MSCEGRASACPAGRSGWQVAPGGEWLLGRRPSARSGQALRGDDDEGWVALGLIMALGPGRGRRDDGGGAGATVRLGRRRGAGVDVGVYRCSYCGVSVTRRA